jgi:hypothetical protein
MIPKSGYRFSEKIMPTINRSKTTPQSTPISHHSNHHRAGPVRSTKPRNASSTIKIMTGELAPARHVPCAATRAGNQDQIHHMMRRL